MMLLNVFLFSLVTFLSSAVAAEWTAPNVLKDVGFDQRLGMPAPLDTPFVDEAGREVKLGDYFGEKPVILNLVYFRCPSLCTEVLNGLVRALRVLKLVPGGDFKVVTISFDAREKPALAAKKAELYRHKYERPVAPGDWAFLTGSESSIGAVSQAVGFRFVYDAQLEQFAHASGLVVLTPDGRVSRYLFGAEYSPKDLRLALAEAGEGKVGGLVEQVLLYCYTYNPATGRYGVAVMRVVRAASVLLLVLLAVFIVVSIRREKRKAAAA